MPSCPKDDAKNSAPLDLNQIAAEIVNAATRAVVEEAEQAAAVARKDPAAVVLGRKGGLKGGKARAANMTADQLREAASKAAKARWGHRTKIG